ncbi:AraC family transcriptional regulator [Fictibacillus macauensis ZFHKF-1]|uniref:AraC family transcriptional regulator n=1 Tax=Fictibacillus macauensis ZFHKF-1 TaxID=1196324 RepID=I8UGX0_9BACL|nr:helix-turn-helix transcriptional regulator [Fictibacillus macauensis]EIT86053.1 AraC family transcriptional regulator [Fictibacillus macauensis ZFHKF-1]
MMYYERAQGALLYTSEKRTEGNLRSDPSYKFIYAIDGNMAYKLPTFDTTLTTHQFVVLNPYDRHQQLAVEQKKFLIELSPSFFQDVSEALPQRDHSLQFPWIVRKHLPLTQWVAFLSTMLHVSSEQEFQLFLDHSFTQLALLLLQTQHPAREIESYRLFQPLIMQTMEAMYEDAQHTWTLDELSSLIHLSKYQYAHVFKECSGISPYSWLQLARLHHAKQALLHSKETILSIALQAGFPSAAAFTQLFKRLFGMTPSVFRANRSNK